MVEQAATVRLQHQPLGLALRPRVGRLHAPEVPRRELVGRLVRRAGGQGVQGRRVDEPLDAGLRGLGQQSGRRLDVDRRGWCRAGPARGRPSSPYGSRRGLPPAPGGARRRPAGRRPANRSADRPARRRAAVARGRAPGVPRRPAARDVTPHEAPGPGHQHRPVGRFRLATVPGAGARLATGPARRSSRTRAGQGRVGLPQVEEGRQPRSVQAGVAHRDGLAQGGRARRDRVEGMGGITGAVEQDDLGAVDVRPDARPRRWRRGRSPGGRPGAAPAPARRA